MTRLNQYNEEHLASIARTEEIVANLAAQLQELQLEIRINRQKAEAQSTIEKEMSLWLKQGKSLMKDLAALYPQEAILDIAKDVNDIAEEVYNNYTEYQTSSRFLTGEIEDEDKPEITELSELPELSESLTDIDGKLSVSGVLYFIDDIDISESVVQKLAQMTGTKARTKNSIAKYLASLGLTESNLLNMIETAKNLTLYQGNQLTLTSV